MPGPALSASHFSGEALRRPLGAAGPGGQVGWRLLILWAMGCTLMLAPNEARAQGRRGLRMRTDAREAASSTRRTTFEFPNVNKVGYYRNPELFSKIQVQKRKGNTRRQLSLMEEYVFNFGIQNFYRDTEMLWQLGQLYERTQQLSKAKALYRLVLRHQPKTRDTLAPYLRRLHLDSLDEDQSARYVSLKYYYELVDFRRSIDTLLPPRSVLTPLGSEINTEFEEYGPAINRTADTLIFSTRRTYRTASKRGEARQLNEDLYFSADVDGDTFWTEAEPLPGYINTEDNEGSPALSPDGRHLYFSRCNAPGTYGSCDIFVSDRLPDGTWGQPRNLGPNINGKAWDSQPSLSHTGDTLYFASDRLGGFGLSDLYYSVRGPGSSWQPARNMGPTINTRGNEVSPFYHPRYRVLYFSSDFHLPNFGLFDIYKSYYRGKAWQEPINIGPLVNGAGSEYYFTIDFHSRYLYYARSEEGSPANLNLYSFPLPMEAQPLAVTQLAGTLTDSGGTPMTGIVSVIDLDHNIEVAPRQLRADGSFDFDLVGDNNYLLIIQGDDFFRIERSIRLRRDTALSEQARRISRSRISFASLDFETGSYEILEEMRPDLDRLLNYLIDHPTYRLSISGHTDQIGDTAANLQLSQDRALAIRDYLTRDGLVDPGRITATGYGSRKPIVPVERNESDRRTNRRVEFEIIYPEGNGTRRQKVSE